MTKDVVGGQSIRSRFRRLVLDEAVEFEVLFNEYSASLKERCTSLRLLVRVSVPPLDLPSDAELMLFDLEYDSREYNLPSKAQTWYSRSDVC